jgi:hypothetical protein
MNSAKSYLREINSVSEALSRLNLEVKKLRQKKKTAENHLFTLMDKYGYEEYEGIKKSKIAPKQKIKKKKADEKKADAMKLFTDIGIQDPEDFWDKFQQTQVIPKEEDENSESV